MRICLVAHGFPPYECTGVEGYTNALAMALAAAGHQVEVFAPRRAPELPDLSMRREERDGFGITWITTNADPKNPNEMLEVPGVAVRFGDHLDREQPEVIHFQHLIKLGIGLLEEAKSRGIPSLYTAHDYYSVCHRVTLMRPDMQRCETIGDPEACSRCDLGLAFLNTQEQLGDYQLGALPAQLDPETWQQLASLLGGDPRPAGYGAEDQAALLEARRELDKRRQAAYEGFDLILSPTRFLRERLIEGGYAAEKIECLTYGAETRDLLALPKVARREGEPLRFGYLGGLAKQKGVHVLLEAFASLGKGASLSIWGASSDTLYVNQIQARAKELGVHWMGPFERPQLASVLAQVDVVVVPSIWVENFPFVIREALAAGRPVITSDVGALPESVRHEVDGLLFAPGDAEALTQAMTRCLEEPGLVERLVAGSGKIKSIEEQVQELVPIYLRLAASRPAKSEPRLPHSLRPWAARYAELSELPQRELFRRVLKGLGHMGQHLRGDDEKRLQADLPSDALANYSKAQTLLRDLKREREWLKDSIRDHAQSKQALQERVDWRETELQELRKEVDWLKRSLEEQVQQTEWLQKTIDSKDVELKSREEEFNWIRASLASKTQECISLREESDWLRRVALEQQKQTEEQHTETLEQHARTQAELDASNAQFVKAIERLQSQRELLGIASGQLDKLHNLMQLMGVLTQRNPLLLSTKIGRLIRAWRLANPPEAKSEEPS